MLYWQVKIELVDGSKTTILVKADKYTEAILHARSLYPYARKIS